MKCDSKAPWTTGLLKVSLLTLAVVMIFSFGASAANAGYTVYSRRVTVAGSTFQRTGMANSINLGTYQQAYANIQQRIAENRRANQDFEAFMIVRTAGYPATGGIPKPNLGEWIVYTPNVRPQARRTLYYIVFSWSGRRYYQGGFTSSAAADSVGRSYERALANRGVRYLAPPHPYTP